MVVPNLHNPRRLHSQRQLGRKNTPHYHLKPDHINSYDTSTYRHVGRRTKRGGGGYVYSSSNNSSTEGGEGNNVFGQVVFWFLTIVYILGACIVLYHICMVCMYCCICLFGAEGEEEEQETDDATQRRERRRRKRLIKSNLHFEVVLSDKSNINIESLRGEGSKEGDDATEAIDEDNGDDDSVIVVSNHDTKKRVATSNSLSSSTSSIYLSVRNYLSSWNLRPKKTDVCSICHDAFQTGQILCVAKSLYCNHIFHKECIQSWLMDHDCCPNCRRKIT